MIGTHSPSLPPPPAPAPVPVEVLPGPPLVAPLAPAPDVAPGPVSWDGPEPSLLPHPFAKRHAAEPRANTRSFCMGISPLAPIFPRAEAGGHSHDVLSRALPA